MYFGVANCTNIFMNNPGFCKPCGFGGFRAFSPGCFGYGFCGMSNPMAVGAGIGLGYAAGATLLPLVPAIFKGIGTAALNFLKKLYNGKEINLHSLYSSRYFYEQNGFRPVEPESNNLYFIA